MIKNLEEQKARLKEKLSQEVEDYFASLEKSTSEEDFDINKMEKLMVANQRRIKSVLNETSSELAGNVETSVKKTARSAEKG